MLVHSRTIAPMSGLLSDEFDAGFDHILLGEPDIHVFLLGLDQDTEKFASVLGANHRRIERDTSALKMGWR